MRPTAEAELERYLVACVAEMGGITAKMTVEGRRGWPDRLVILPYAPVAAILFVELKKPKTGRASAGQKTMHATLHRLRARVVQLNSREQIDRVLEEYLPVVGQMKKHS